MTTYRLTIEGTDDDDCDDVRNTIDAAIEGTRGGWRYAVRGLDMRLRDAVKYDDAGGADVRAALATARDWLRDELEEWGLSLG
jgi:hypothetical protein